MGTIGQFLFSGPSLARRMACMALLAVSALLFMGQGCDVDVNDLTFDDPLVTAAAGQALAGVDVDLASLQATVGKHDLDAALGLAATELTLFADQYVPGGHEAVQSGTQQQILALLFDVYLLADLHTPDGHALFPATGVLKPQLEQLAAQGLAAGGDPERSLLGLYIIVTAAAMPANPLPAAAVPTSTPTQPSGSSGTAAPASGAGSGQREHDLVFATLGVSPAYLRQAGNIQEVTDDGAQAGAVLLGAFPGDEARLLREDGNVLSLVYVAAMLANLKDHVSHMYLYPSVLEYMPQLLTTAQRVAAPGNGSLQADTAALQQELTRRIAVDQAAAQ
ncbi:MAG: hypothetical protein QOF51_3623 [Chloroflexota bacterium]|jgi:hypothetical protein|nr:hypothetical protein [Chloroflexota bacterium]